MHHVGVLVLNYFEISGGPANQLARYGDEALRGMASFSVTDQVWSQL